MDEAQEITIDDVVRAGRVLFGPAFAAEANAWRDALRSTYRRRALETHPDRARALGRAERELAREFHAVADAYRLLSSLRAGPLPAAAAPPDVWVPAQARAAAHARAHAGPQTGPRPGPHAAPHAGSHAAPHAGAHAGSRGGSRAAPQTGPGAGAHAGTHTGSGAGPHAHAPPRPSPAATPWPPRDARASAGPRPWTPPRPAPPPAAGPRVRASVRPQDLPRRRLRFAEFLYYSGIVRWSEFVEAIAWQRAQRPPVGRIAVDFGFLAPDDVGVILERRREAGAHYVPFGEWALRLGYLTSFQLLATLGQQLRRQRRIGQFFVERGLLDEDEIDPLRRRILRHNAPYGG